MAVDHKNLGGFGYQAVFGITFLSKFLAAKISKHHLGA